MWTLLTFILVTVSLKLAAVLGSKLGMNVGTDELALIPFRLLLKLSSFEKILIFFRVTLLNNSPQSENFFSRGFASNMTFQIWATFGGICLT